MAEKEELWLELDKECGKGGKCTCTRSPSKIQAKKEDGEVNGVQEFFSYVHELSDGGIFRLNKSLGNEQLLGPLTDVTKVSIYYWKKAASTPLLLEAKTPTGIEYYYKYSADELIGKTDNPDGKTWTYDKNPNTPLQERLDDRNCGINGPTVFDAKTPLSSPLSKKSDCARTRRKITSVSREPPFSIGDDYIVNTFKVEGNYTRISRVTYGGANTTGIYPPNEEVTKIRVFLWKYKENIPLLIEFKTEKGSTWFANKKKESTYWTNITSESQDFYKQDDYPPQVTPKLTTKLDEVNCNVNHVVQINTLNKGESNDSHYCHGEQHTHTPKRISVKDVTEAIYPNNKLFNYKVFSHSPNEEAYTKKEPTPYKFIVSKFHKNGGELTGIIQPPKPYIPDVTRVLVYFCGDDPLLIYYKRVYEGSFDNHIRHHWYKKDSDTWTTVPHLSTARPDLSASYPKILKELDSIRSPCQIPSVTIDIKFWLKEDEKTYDSQDSSCANKRYIEVTSTQVPDTTDYTFFTHTVKDNTRGYFTVQKVEYGKSEEVSFVDTKPPIEKVKEFTVYYWTPLGDKGNPILIKIDKLGSSNPEWFWNLGKSGKNATWHKINDSSHVSEPSNLLKKLILLNCKLNNVTVIDIGKKPTDKYCHQGDINIKEESHDPIIQVTDVTQNPTYKGRLGSFVVYEHSLSSEAKSQKPHLGNKFHISELKNTNTNLQFKNESPIPVLNVTNFLVFWCDKDETKGKPLLIYFKRSTTPPEDSSIEEWYKKDGESWIKLDNSNGKPSNASDTRAINKILNSYDTECKDRTMFYILIGVPAALGPPGIAYGIWYWYNFLRGPWLRLM